MEPKLRRFLSQRRKRRINDPGRVPAAVLMPVYRKQGQYHILFIKRTDTVKTHRGEVSFPGGTYQAEDGTMLNTALRECAEEIGLRAGDVEILGELDDEATATSNYTVSPFVALIPWPYRFRKCPAEVAEIIEAPVAALLDGDCRRQNTETGEAEFHYQGRVIWGATARMLDRFLDIFRRASRED